MTSRRAFLGSLAAMGVVLDVRGQPAAPLRIGWISYAPPGDGLPAFQEGMAALGYAGRDAPSIEVRVVAPNAQSVRAAVEELQALPVALIIAQAAIAPMANRIVAGRTPLVFAFSGDPVVAGLVESFGRPGGNATGISFLALDLVGKRLELMKEILPSLRRVAILANPQHPGEKAELKVSLEASERLGLQTSYVPILPVETPDAAFERIRGERVQGVIVFQDAGMSARAVQIAEFALKERLVAVSGWAQFAQAGFLASYGPSFEDGYRRLATYATRVLRGAHTADLPVELPTRIDLAINLRTAKALGLNISQALLSRADQVIR